MVSDHCPVCDRAQCQVAAATIALRAALESRSARATARGARLACDGAHRDCAAHAVDWRARARAAEAALAEAQAALALDIDQRESIFKEGFLAGVDGGDEEYNREWHAWQAWNRSEAKAAAEAACGVQK